MSEKTKNSTFQSLRTLRGVARQFWLMKSEPEVYGIHHLAAEKTTLWEGVRNYQARNFMWHNMKSQDLFVFYHSNAKPSGAVGVGRILTPGLVDPTALDPKSKYFDPKATSEKPRWYCAKVEYILSFPEVLSISTLRSMPELADCRLLSPGQRLSVMPLKPQHFDSICRHAFMDSAHTGPLA